MQSLSKRKLQDAVRLAIQSAAAAASMFVLMQAMGLNEKFVGVLSAVLVVQPSLGTTLGAAWERLTATLVGCGIGTICLFALPDGYGTAVALAISMLVINGIAAIRQEWRYGVVAAVALALGAESNAIQTAIDRSMAIGIGVTVGILVSVIVWPERSSTRARRHLEEALRAAASTLSAIVTEAAEGEASESAAHRSFQRELNAARDTAEQVRIADNDTLLREIDAVERFQRGLIILRRIADGDDTVFAKNSNNREMIVSVQQSVHDIIDDLLSSGTTDGKRFDAIKADLDALRAGLSEGGGDHRQHVQNGAFVFALDEIQASLETLVEILAA